MRWIQQLQSANWSQVSGMALSSYLLGCFATGYYLVRWRTGQDIRALGSGNVGARNVGRILGKVGFGLTLLGDFIKGVLAVWAVHHWTRDDQLAAMAMLAVTAGHIWPVQLGFRGGKGVATSLGALLAYDPRLAVTFGICLQGALRCCARQYCRVSLLLAACRSSLLAWVPVPEPFSACFCWRARSCWPIAKT